MAKTDSLTVEEFVKLREHLARHVVKITGGYSDDGNRQAAAERMMYHPAFNCRAGYDDMLDFVPPAKAVKVDKK